MTVIKIISIQLHHKLNTEKNNNNTKGYDTKQDGCTHRTPLQQRTYIQRSTGAKVQEEDRKTTKRMMVRKCNSCHEVLNLQLSKLTFCPSTNLTCAYRTKYKIVVTKSLREIRSSVPYKITCRKSQRVHGLCVRNNIRIVQDSL